MVVVGWCYAPKYKLCKELFELTERKGNISQCCHTCTKMSRCTTCETLEHYLIVEFVSPLSEKFCYRLNVDIYIIEYCLSILTFTSVLDLATFWGYSSFSHTDLQLATVVFGCFQSLLVPLLSFEHCIMLPVSLSHNKACLNYRLVTWLTHTGFSFPY